ncbi:hypothetical protein [Salinarimonas chemoclinalis]|uniref:hypothetical protein n=1 Tax=Salinarimonas chemoclinalis TaxID=3241599 RepID=UPI003557D891
MRHGAFRRASDAFAAAFVPVSAIEALLDLRPDASASPRGSAPEPCEVALFGEAGRTVLGTDVGSERAGRADPAAIGAPPDSGARRLC